MDYFDSILRKTHRKAVMKRVIAVLSAVVLLFTINTTKKTADTLERIPTCGVEEHVHTDACFDVDGNLICGFVEHVHTDACYQERPKSVDTFEPPVEEYQIELSDVDQADNVLSASTEAGSEANAMSMDIEAPVEESGELELEDINGEDNIAMPSDESEVFPESEESQGYIVGAQNPCYLSDIIADQGLNIAIDDVVEIGQAIENDDDPILFNFELVDGDIALYVKEDFERAELVITTEDALHVVELLFGIAPIEETSADVQEAEVSAEEPADVALGDIDQEQAIEGEEREEGLAEAAGDAVQAADVEDDQLISEPAEDEAELLDEFAEDIQVEQDAGKDDETVEQADESIEEIADTEESADEQDDAIADEGIEEDEQTDGEATEEEAEDEKSDESKEERIEEAEDEQADETEGEETKEESEDEKSDESKAEETEEAGSEKSDESKDEETEEETEDEKSDESKDEETEEETEDEKSDESKAEETEEAGNEKSDESKAEETEEETEDEKSDESKDEETEDEESDESEDEQTGEVQGDETGEAPDVGAQPVPPEVVYAYYEATIDLADVEVYPIALTDLMARATWLGVEETAPAADVEEAAVAEPVSEPAETEPPEADALEEDVSDEGTAEVVEAEAVDPVQSEAAFELDGEDTVEPEVPEVPESDAWVMDYDASVLSVERDGDDYALSILTSFEQTTLTVDNGKQYRITLLNGAAPVLYPAAAFAASTEYVTVSVEAPEGAFPAGTTMVVRDVDDEDTLHGISDKVEEGFVRVECVHAVDITFLNADGEEIEPLLPISVVMSIRKTEQDESTVVVHMDDDGNAEVIQETTQAEKTEEDEESVAFRSDTFSVYAVVVTKILETRFISAEGETYEITVTYAEDAAIPMGATLEVREIEGEAAHEYLEQAEEAVEQQIALARFFNIEIWDGDKKIEPEASVSVSVRLLDVPQEKETVPMVVHFAKAGLEVMEVNEADKTAGETELIFTTDEFSIYGVLAMKSAVEDVFGKIGKTTADNVAIRENHYTVSSKKATIPNKGTRVTLLGTANGILGGMISKWYQIEYTDEAGVVYTGYVEQDDIEIVNVVETEPVDYASFTAKLSYDAGVLPEGTALSFGEPTLNGSEWTEVLDLLNGLRKNKTYAIQEISWFDLSFIHENVEIEPNGAVHVNIAMKQPMAVAENESLWLIHFASSGVEVVDSARFSIENSSAVGVDFTVNSFSAFAIVKVIETTVITDSGETFRISVSYGTEAGIPDDAQLKASEILQDDGDYAGHVTETAEFLGDTVEALAHVRLFDIAIVDADGERVPLSAPVQVEIEYVDPVEIDTAQPIRIVHFAEAGTEIINPTTNRDEAGMVDTFAFETASFSIYSIVSSGATSNLDGKTFAIVNTYTGNAVQSTKQNNNSRLSAAAVTVNDDEGYVTANDDIEMWTFEARGNNTYYIRSSGGQYLNISSSAVTVSDDTPQALTVTAGTGTHAGQVRIKDNDSAINNYSGSTSGGFGRYNDSGNNEWFTLYDLVNLNHQYTANKISVQDLEDAQEVVIYKNVYNETSGEYEVYVIDGNGDLVKAYDKGDRVTGRSGVSTVWSVMMHRDATTHELNGYYDFYNEETGMFLSPKSDGTLVASTKPGVLLNGRSDGNYNSTIEAWNQSVMANYGYQIIADEDGDPILATGTGDNSQEFSFAAYVSETTNELHTVETVDSTAAGITIKMYDFSSRAQITNVVGGDRYIEGDWYNNSGLASKRLGADGFPYFDATGKSAAELFSSANYQGEANNLFLKSVYDSTGYYEYSGFNNFAKYDQNTGNFTVYQEIGTPSNDDKYFYKRGNFMPFSSLDVNRKATNVNLYDGGGGVLSPLDPTQSGTLYLVQNNNDSNYWFGMTMEATFMQPKDGRDRNGPVVYDFNGDDDLWVYIDGVLILDIGGVHDALPGSINFATGEIKYGRNSTIQELTIKDCFKKAGVFPDGTPWDDSKVDQYFKDNTFLDYSSHDLKMFYMEHGKGASNLEVHFNLPVIEKGKFTVEKVLDGTTQQKFANVYFAFQAFKKDGTNDVPLIEAVYEGTTTPVQFHDSVEINGNTYDNVFYLKPGEAATFAELDETEEYYVQELGIGTDYYDQVVVNDVMIDGQEATAQDGIYPTTVATVGNRARVTYSNHCSEQNLNDLRITKRISEGSMDDGSTFEFRVLIENANGELVPYSNGEYCIQDDEGNYYRYVDGVLTRNGKTPIAASTAGQNGTIGSIPPDYTVVIRGLLAGTDFYVEEIRLPDGWVLDQKTVEEESCAESDLEGTGFAGDTVTADGQIILDKDAQVVFTNGAGKRIVVKKVWQSGNLVTQHGDIQVALFTVDEEDQSLTMVERSLRTISTSESEQTASIEYRLTGNIEDYVVREVVVDAETGTVMPIDNQGILTVTGENTTLGVDAAGSYAVAYALGTVKTADEDGVAIAPVREDTITNTMPTLTVNKTDLDGRPLSGAVFTLLRKVTVESEESEVAVKGYENIVSTDAESGNLLSDLYLPNGTYYLKEISAPPGYVLLEHQLKITVSPAGITMMTDVETGAINYTNLTSDDSESEGYQTSAANTTYTFAVANNPGASLPATGGPGTTGFYILGSLLTILAAALLLRRKEL